MTDRQRLFFKAGAWLAIVTAIVHLVAHVAGPSEPANEAERAFVEQFRTLRFEVPGGSRTMYEFMRGFSLMESVFYGMFGGLNLLIVRRARDDAPLMAAVTRLDAACAITMVIISLTYFFIVPTVLFALVAVCFVAALFGKSTAE